MKDFLDVFYKLLIYIVKNNRPRMERYGTSQIIVFTQDVKPYVDTNFFLFEKKDRNHWFF